MSGQSAHNPATEKARRCCCHSFEEECRHGWNDDLHVHRCMPTALDLGGHCPDDGCAGSCWLRPKPGVVQNPGGVLMGVDHDFAPGGTHDNPLGGVS